TLDPQGACSRRAADIAEDTNRFRAKLEGSTALRYALAPVCIAVAVLLQIAVIGPAFPVWSQTPPPTHPAGLFQVCIVVAAWFGGAGAGVLSGLLSPFVPPPLLPPYRP